jgi:hypothetical protein
MYRDHSFLRSVRVVAVAAGLLALTTAVAAAPSGTAAAATALRVNVTVNTLEGLGTIPATGYGLNSAVWDSQMNAPAVQNLLGQAGIGMLRYPGGSYGDIYNWQTNTAPGGYVAPGTDFDSFMGTVKTIGAQPILIANYGTGTPQEAAAWVQYANVTKGYGDKYWEVGNENYGNGYYGNGWEADDHSSKSPTTYAQNVIQYSKAMKAVDPTIKVGAVLTLPGNWPDGVVASGDAADWNRTVLSIAGSAVDFVIVHWYPNGSGAATAPDGATDYGDWGVLSSGTCVGSVCEPAMNTPFPSYFALSMLSKLGHPGDRMVRAGTDQQLVAAHAVRQANGNLAVMLVNKDPANAYTVNLHYAGYTPSTATPTVYTYGDEAASITSAAQGSSAVQTLPPYSIQTIVLTPSGNPVSTLTAPGSPSVSHVTGTQATVSWTPSAGGTATRYEVYRQFGTTSELLAESTSTSATIDNLVPGSGYTLNVLATDQNGNLSPPSDPVSFTTGTPSNSTCAVNYQVTTGWGSGYVAAITVANTGPSPIDGWSLTFTFPGTGETLGSGWNANWSGSGQNVEATSLTWNANLAAGGGNSASIGFVGNNTGAYPSPAVISLNGTVCTTTYSS